MTDEGKIDVPAVPQGVPDAYDMIDRFLRNNLDDDDYAEYSASLDSIATPAPAPAQEAVTLTDDQADAVSMALRRAWQLGQTYWQQADSDYISQHKKSEETQRKFEKLCDDTIAALRAKGAV